MRLDIAACFAGPVPLSALVGRSEVRPYGSGDHLQESPFLYAIGRECALARLCKVGREAGGLVI